MVVFPYYVRNRLSSSPTGVYYLTENVITVRVIFESVLHLRSKRLRETHNKKHILYLEEVNFINTNYKNIQRAHRKACSRVYISSLLPLYVLVWSHRFDPPMPFSCHCWLRLPLQRFQNTKNRAKHADKQL